MNKDTIKGAATDAKGSIERAVGKAMGDSSLVAKGAADQAIGKTEKVLGKVKDALRRDTRP